VRDAPADDALAERLLAAVALLQRSARRVAARPAELARLTGSQLELVRLVRRRPGVSVAEAAAELRLAANTVSTLVGQLADAGLLARSVDAADRRVARLDLAPALRETVDAWHDRRVLAVAEALGHLPARDARLLAAALEPLERLGAELEREGRAR
jgi:DNA-binding MarR family transcriptional regulator